MRNALQNLRVILVDDHDMVRLGFRFLIEGAGGEVIAESSAAAGAVELYRQHQPDLLITDVSMPGVDGLTLLERLRAAAPDARVLVLSAHDDDIIPVRALRAGALGYLCKRATPDEFIRAVAAVGHGKRYLDPQLAQAVALAQLSGTGNPIETLTEKELAVFLRLARGHSVNQIAADLCVSPSTVGTHLYHLKQKLNLQNAAEITLAALRYGLIEQ